MVVLEIAIMWRRKNSRAAVTALRCALPVMTWFENCRARGNSYATIAAALGIGPDAFRRLREQDEELKDALAVGHGALATELTDILLTQARTGLPCTHWGQASRARLD